MKCYRSIIEAHFTPLGSGFEPHSDGAIGFVGEVMAGTRRLGYFGFRGLRADDPDVLLLPVRSFTAAPEFLYAHGVHEARMIGSPKGFAATFDAVVKHEIAPQLATLVERGQLDERGAPALSEELLHAIVAAHPSIFSNSVDHQTGRPRYPISLASIARALRRACLFEHFDHIRLEDRRRHGHVPETRDGRFVSYSWRPSDEDKRRIEEQVSTTLRDGKDPEHLFAPVNLRELARRVRIIIDRLGGEDAIVSAPQPWGSQCVHLYSACDHLRMDPIALGDAFVTFYRAYLDSYKRVVEASFPTLKQHLPLYSKLPVSVLLTVSHAHHWDQSAYPVLIVTSRGKDGQTDNEVSAVDAGDISFRNHEPVLRGKPLDYFRCTTATRVRRFVATPLFATNCSTVLVP